ncbi:Tol-Pal system beta propeller repeat protein TolB [Govanella unica]|uniref:Tol-Pal system protein TolB n=1 Tax=Govanella unica TaxID=2975056 RepID=A0A9X3Z8F8_9PROT|nr:Tol-Pal system beta propeller repeat protein TolB [Govania unica]MDA5194914.1 Tol-Pal system beta propeller repeat protein TolB [Govania unica]
MVADRGADIARFKVSSVVSGLCLVLAAFFLIAVPAPAWAVLKVDITKGNVDPLPIAITAFTGVAAEKTLEGGTDEIGRNIAGVITNNLARSGLFRTIDPKAFINAGETPGGRPNFGNWRGIGAQALVTGQVQLQTDGRLRVEFRLWDVYGESQMTGLQYFSAPRTWRQVAHMVSDAIYKRLTGEDGYFNTRIVYISESGPMNKREKRLAIMDQDGYNHRFLTSGKDLVLTPRFSPTAQEITYMAYYNNRPRVYLYNIDTGTQELLGDYPGMTFAPRFAPDGNKVIFSMAASGNTDIYEMDLRTRKSRRLTADPNIDTSPSYSPDGQEIVFNSDRGGTQQLYVMDANGGNVRRISFGDGRYATPVWSPRGDLIAFTKQSKGRFYIGVMRPDGKGERLLTESFMEEGPTWAPNGRVIIFYRKDPYDRNGKGGATSLWSVDLTGYNLRKIITPLDASDPAWSPLLR